MKVKQILLRFSFAAGIVIPAFPAPGVSQEYQVSLVASSIANSELGHFNTALSAPVIEGDYVVFRTLNNSSAVAFIWSFNIKTKQFTKLADLSMAAPGGTGNFTDLNGLLGGPVLKDGIVIFGARDSKAVNPPVNNQGIFSVPVTGGAIQRVANYNTAVPGGTGNFFSHGGISSGRWGNVSFSDGVVGFDGEFGGGPIGNRGIYQSDIGGGNMAPIADSLHPIGDIFPIQNFIHVSVNENRAAFIGGNVFGYSTLFSTNLPASLGNCTSVIKVDTVLPGATGGFSFVFPSVQLFKNSIFFIALDSVPGGNNNRRTLYEIPFAGGAPTKILSNFDTLEGISTIEQSSISSYDVNPTHVLIRAKAPGSNNETGLYLYDRSAATFTRIFRVDQQVLDRTFGYIEEIQPGSMTQDSSMVVASIAGSALFVGPYNYIVLLSKSGVPGPGGGDDISALTAALQAKIAAIRAALVQARKKLPAKPGRSLSKKKRAKINKQRRAILDARNLLTNLLQDLKTTETTSGVLLRTVYPNFNGTGISQLEGLKTTASAKKTKTKAAKQAWQSFDTALTALLQ